MISVWSISSMKVINYTCIELKLQTTYYFYLKNKNSWNSIFKWFFILCTAHNRLVRFNWFFLSLRGNLFFNKDWCFLYCTYVTNNDKMKEKKTSIKDYWLLNSIWARHWFSPYVNFTIRGYLHTCIIIFFSKLPFVNIKILRYLS